MPVRDLDSFSGTSDKPLRILCNRGASGIDGNVSTLLGLAAANKGSDAIVAGLIGDLAFCHDMNGLLAAKDLNALIVVLNNDGGGIFHHLPQAALPEFERAWRTSTGLDLSKAAELYSVGFSRVDNPVDFEGVLDNALFQTGVRIIEVKINPEQSLDQHRRYWHAVIGD